jgi:hypothetical protein
VRVLGAADPQIAGTGDRVLRKRRHRICVPVLLDREQGFDFLGVEAGEVQIEISRAQILEFKGQQVFVPVRPGHRAVHHQAKSLHLRRGPFVAKQDRHFGDAELTGSLQTQVAINDFSVAAGEHRNLEAELTDAAAHAIDGGVILPRVARVEDEPIGVPGLNLRLCRDQFALRGGKILPAHFE